MAGSETTRPDPSPYALAVARKRIDGEAAERKREVDEHASNGVQAPP
jgi:hypothetical protein